MNRQAKKLESVICREVIDFEELYDVVIETQEFIGEWTRGVVGSLTAKMTLELFDTTVLAVKKKYRAELIEVHNKRIKGE